MKSNLDYLPYNRRRTARPRALQSLHPRKNIKVPPALFVMLGLLFGGAILAVIVMNIPAGDQAAVPTLPYLQPTYVKVADDQAAALLPSASLTPLVALTSEPVSVPVIKGKVGSLNQTLRLRALPATTSEVLALLEPNTELTLTGRSADNEWYQVEADGQSGWVMAVWIDAEAGTLPIIDPPTMYHAASGAEPVTEAKPSDDSHVEDYLYIAGISPKLNEILSQGRKAGNRLNVFSKVGDSVTDNEFFLRPIGAGNYDLRRYDYLAPVIDYYSQAQLRTGNSFDNLSLAALSGWTIRDLLNPQKANPTYCRADETPLECEYRVSKPSVALILIGTNDLTAITPEAYEENLRQVIEITLERGIIPVISTVPPYLNDGQPIRRVHEYNGVIARLAEEYEIPLWDYWAAMNILPNYGLWDDGIHPNWNIPADFTEANLQYGQGIRNLTALQALDAVWRALGLDEGSTG